MVKVVFALFISLFSSNLFAWGTMAGSVDVLHVNTYGNYSEPHLNNGFCFKLSGYDHYLKVAYFDTGERKKNVDFVQSMVLAAYLSKRDLSATYVNWGEYPTCRVRGTAQPAKWLEDVHFVNL